MSRRQTCALNLSPSSWLIGINDYYLQSSVSYYDLHRKVQHYLRAADVVKGRSFDLSSASREQISKLAASTARLYGLLHRRFCVTEDGAAKFSQKVALGNYGMCPRVSCKSRKLLSVGLTSEPDCHWARYRDRSPVVLLSSPDSITPLFFVFTPRHIAVLLVSTFHFADDLFVLFSFFSGFSWTRV
jgi:hypothetical protein